jgi:hypothetical protein
MDADALMALVEQFRLQASPNNYAQGRAAAAA